MFLGNSRYSGVELDEIIMPDGRAALAVRLRRLGSPDAEATVVKGNDRLDIMSERRYDDATKFWHIADSNTELQSGQLIATPNRLIQVPRH